MIVGFQSPLDGRTYGLEELHMLGRVMPEALLREMVRKERDDARHSGLHITITSGLGCPREMLIHRLLPTTPDPQKLWAVTKGTMLHREMGRAMEQEQGWLVETREAERCTFHGTLFGVPMSCRVDAVRDDYSRLIDWKFRKDGAEKFVDAQREAKGEDAAQCNMARMLIEQHVGHALPGMVMEVWVMAGETVRTVAPHMDERQVGEVRAGSGKYSVREVFAMLAGTAGQLAALPLDEPALDVGPHIESAIRALPMVGETMYTGRTKSVCKCTSWCSVKEACYSIQGGI